MLSLFARAGWWHAPTRRRVTSWRAEDSTISVPSIASRHAKATCELAANCLDTTVISPAAGSLTTTRSSPARETWHGLCGFIISFYSEPVQTTHNPPPDRGHGEKWPHCWWKVLNVKSIVKSTLRRSGSFNFKVTNFGTNRKPICDFLLVINTNLPFTSCLAPFPSYGWLLVKFPLPHFNALAANIAINDILQKNYILWPTFPLQKVLMYLQPLPNSLTLHGG